MDNTQIRHAMRAIRRLANPMPSTTAQERLDKIIAIATGETDASPNAAAAAADAAAKKAADERMQPASPDRMTRGGRKRESK